MAPMTYPTSLPAQHQSRQPGLESQMNPLPIHEDAPHAGSPRLAGKVALITGGDSGIGKSVALAFAREGADVAIVYLNEHGDAEGTRQRVQQLGRRCLTMAADVRDETQCQQAVKQVMDAFGRLDVLINNAAEQHPQASIADITRDQLERTFQTNIFSCFYMTKAALPHLKPGSAIINTASVTAYEGNPQLVDYASTKGAMVAFTRSLAKQLVDRGIRVNAVAPGPIWTPLIPSTFTADQVAKFGQDTPMKRAGQPVEVAPSYVFLASEDASYMTGQVLHPNGGTAVNG